MSNTSPEVSFADGNIRDEGVYSLRGRSLALFSIPRPADSLV